MKLFQKNNADSETRYKLMTTEKVPKLIISMAIPAIISQIVSSLYSLADTYFVSSIGTAATAAPGVAFPILLIIQAISLMFAVGAGSLASRQLGAMDNEEANKTVSTAFFLSVFIGTFLGIVCLILLKPIMILCGATNTILPYACDYAFWIILATPFYSASFVLSYVIRQEGNVRLATIGTITGAVVNCVLDPLFIYVFHWGIVGAAVATSLSQIVSFTIMFTHIIRGKCVLKLSWKYFSAKWKRLWEICKVGAPNLFQSALLVIGQIMLNNAAKVYGDGPLAGMNVVTKVSNIIVLSLNGFGQGFQPMCGYCYGAKLYNRIKEGLWFTLKAGLTIIVALSAISYILAPEIIALFRAGDAEVIDVGSRIMRAHMVVMPLYTVTVVANMMFLSCGKALKAAIVTLARNGIVFIPLILVLPKLFYLDGVIWAQPIADAITFAISGILLVVELKQLSKGNAELKSSVA